MNEIRDLKKLFDLGPNPEWILYKFKPSSRIICKKSETV